MPNTRRLTTWALAAVGVSLVVTAAWVAISVSRLIGLSELNIRRQRAISAAQSLQSLVERAEMAQRGFLLTGDARYQQPYDTSMAGMTEAISQLRAAANEDPGQRARLETFIAKVERRRSLLSQGMETRKAGGFEAARQFAAADDGPQMLTELQAAAEAIVTEERRLYAAVRGASGRTSVLARRSVYGALVASFGLLIVAAFRARRELRDRQEAEQAAQAAYERSEERIRARTQELSEANNRLRDSEQAARDALASRAEALEHAQIARAEAESANRTKDGFLATVSHELRTPLNAIVGWVHLLRSNTLGPEESGRAIAAVARNADVQVKLIDDLLDISRMIQGGLTLSLQSIDLRLVVGAALETVGPAAAAKGVALEFKHDAAPVTVMGDAARLQQVVWNLLSNAVKFTPKGGRVSVTLHQAGNRATLGVADSGEGIDPGFLDQAFEPFQQGSSRATRVGLGLGLAIVRQLTELHGGRVEAHSGGKGLGCTFTVSLPSSPTLPHAAAASHPPGHLMLTGVKVLAAEDDEDAGIVLSTILSHRGCEVRTVRTSRDCVAMLQQWRPDVLVFDLGLPDEDGYQLLERVRSMNGGAPVAIALTAYAGEDDRARSLAAGFVAHLSKPLDPEQVVLEIARASGKAQKN